MGTRFCGAEANVAGGVRVDLVKIAGPPCPLLHCAMNLLGRQRIGFGLMVLSLLAGIIIQWKTGSLIELHFGPLKIDGSGSDRFGSWMAMDSNVDFNVNGWWFFPLLGCIVIGGICRLWPGGKSKKPPVITD
jgi:hypothetical protein